MNASLVIKVKWNKWFNTYVCSHAPLRMHHWWSINLWRWPFCVSYHILIWCYIPYKSDELLSPKITLFNIP